MGTCYEPFLDIPKQPKGAYDDNKESHNHVFFNVIYKCITLLLMS